MGGLAAGAGLASLGGVAGRPAWAQGQPKRGGILKVATVDKPVNMDPGFAQLYSSLQVYQNVYNKLLYVDEAGQFVPGLARSWKADGEKAWVFDLVKFVPAEQSGGIKALRALAGPFPNIRVCPTGGIGEANAADWLAEPNVLAVGGSWLCPAADIRSGNWAGITAMCARTMKLLKPA
jgi:hypothetical protein